MTFLPLAETSNSKAYLFLAIAAAVVLIFYFIKKAGAGKATAEQVAETATTDVPVQEIAATPVDAPADAQEENSGIPHIPGYVVLDGVSEQDAAVLMAITSHRTGIDLSRLDFKSIKRLNQDPVLENVEEQDAAAIMAITSDRTGIPLENLIFNSIKLVEG